MARGWESKGVEDQIQEAEERARRAGEPPVDESPEARARRQRRETLRLSRARTLDQLEHATKGAHREMLQRTLRAIELEREELEREERS
jgi:hypothetical protein